MTPPWTASPNWRDDVALPGVSKQDALRNAPVKDSDYFKVPRVVDKG